MKPVIIVVILILILIIIKKSPVNTSLLYSNSFNKHGICIRIRTELFISFLPSL